MRLRSGWSHAKSTMMWPKAIPSTCRHFHEANICAQMSGLHVGAGLVATRSFGGPAELLDVRRPCDGQRAQEC